MQMILVTGFLGSGKTTLVRELLAQAGRTGLRTAVIVNEFGEIGIDGAILNEGSVDTIELSNGCLCCTLRGSAEAALAQLMSRPGLDRIVIEASGAAAPLDLLALLRHQAELNRAAIGPHVGVIDASRYLALDGMLGEFLDRQIQDADVLVLNKSDLVSTDELQEVLRRVASLHPSVEVVATSHCQVDAAHFAGRGLQAQPVPSAPAAASQAEPHLPHLAFESLVMEVERDVLASDLESRFATPIPGLLRAKGFVRIDGISHLIQYAGGSLQLTPHTQATRHELVFIGRDLDEAEIARRFDAFACRRPLARLRRAGKRAWFAAGTV